MLISSTLRSILGLTRHLPRRPRRQQRQQGTEHERGAKARQVDQGAGDHRREGVRQRGPDRDPAEHALEVSGVARHLPGFALDRHRGDAGGAAGQQGRHGE
jgi:hypothetical protein